MGGGKAAKTTLSVRKADVGSIAGHRVTHLDEDAFASASLEAARSLRVIGDLHATRAGDDMRPIVTHRRAVDSPRGPDTPLRNALAFIVGPRGPSVGSKSRRVGYMDRDRGGGGGRFDRGPREMHDVICADCGKQTQVPFKPDGTRPVYCQECFRKRAPRRY